MTPASRGDTVRDLMTTGPTPRTRPNPTLSIARASARHPVWAVCGWVVLVAGCVLLGQMVGMVSATPVDLGNGDSRRAAQLVHEAGLTRPSTEYVLIGPASASTDEAEIWATAEELVAALGSLDQVDHVGDPVPQVDRTGQPLPDAEGWLLLPLTLTGDPQTAYERVGPVRETTARIAADHPDVVVEQTGQASIRQGNIEQLDKDFLTSETLSIPLTLVVLVMVFGAFVAAVVPVVLALSAVGGAMGLSAVISHLVPDSGMTSNLILLIGMAVGVDYSLFYLRREREERLQGADPRTAIEKAAETSGHAVVFAGSAVVVSLAGLYLADDTMFISLAWSAILVVVVAVLGSLTVLPALLVLLSKYLDRPRVPLVWRLTNRTLDQTREPRLWPTLLRPSLNHPAATMLVTTVLLLAAAAPALSMKMAAQQISELPSSIPAIATLHTMNDKFPAVSLEFGVVVRADASDSATVRTRLEELAAAQSADLGEPPVVYTSADGRTSTVNIVSTIDPTSDAAADYLVTLRQTLVPEALRDVPGAEGVVGGTTATEYDFSQNMRSRLGLVVGFVLLFNLLVMATTFRSLVIGIVTLMMNLLSTGVAFGALAVLFQHHWFDSLVGFTTTGKVISWVPLFLFVVLVGLSMDYHVFVLHRVYEAARSGVAHREAVRNGIIRSAGVVTSAAIVMVVMFTMFAVVSSFQDFIQLTAGLTIAVLVDVVVIRAFLMPATLLVLGRWTWWPSSLSRLVAPRPAVGPRYAVVPGPAGLGLPPGLRPTVGRSAVGPRPAAEPVRPSSRLVRVVENPFGRPPGIEPRGATPPPSVVRSYRTGRPLVDQGQTPVRGTPVVPLVDSDRTPTRGLPRVQVRD